MAIASTILTPVCISYVAGLFTLPVTVKVARAASEVCVAHITDRPRTARMALRDSDDMYFALYGKSITAGRARPGVSGKRREDRSRERVPRRDAQKAGNVKNGTRKRTAAISLE